MLMELRRALISYQDHHMLLPLSRRPAGKHLVLALRECYRGPSGIIPVLFSLHSI